jgi:hypothetical protein
VGQHVVHLPGDPVAFEVAGPCHEKFFLGLDPPGPVTLGLPAGADVHPPGEHGRDADDAEHGLGPVRDRHVRPDPQGDQRGERVARHDQRDHHDRPVHGDREQRDERNTGRGHREHAQQPRDHREADRPPPAHPEPEAANAAEHTLHHELPGGSVLFNAVDEDERRETQAQREEHAIAPGHGRTLRERGIR